MTSLRRHLPACRCARCRACHPSRYEEVANVWLGHRLALHYVVGCPPLRCGLDGLAEAREGRCEGNKAYTATSKCILQKLTQIGRQDVALDKRVAHKCHSHRLLACQQFFVEAVERSVEVVTTELLHAGDESILGQDVRVVGREYSLQRQRCALLDLASCGLLVEDTLPRCRRSLARGRSRSRGACHGLCHLLQIDLKLLHVDLGRSLSQRLVRGGVVLHCYQIGDDACTAQRHTAHADGRNEAYDYKHC